MMRGMLTPPAAIEALLFASGEPIEKKRLGEMLGLTEKEFVTALGALSNSLEDRGVTLIETATEIELRTSAEASDIVKKFRENEFSRDLGSASLETLAVIAYREGATRSEIDWVRGVNSSTSLRTLLLRGLIEGREDERDKRRVRYSLTTDALAHLGVSRADELPRAAELRTAAVAVAEESVATDASA